ncbi:hypothetical protein ACFT9I_30845 [Streptomyces sp. NPDC057137]|uniref:hypothetical protein n=1 Tax=Streptomyces sp. NPDC057137 TaxID=3346030 RepID=UPI0036377FB1
MAITFGLPVVLLWLILGLLPVRNPSARRLWIGIYMGISMLVLLIAYLYSADNQTSGWADSADDQYFMLLYAAVLVGPGMLAALVRLLVSQPDPPAPPPYAPQYPPPYPPPYPHPPRNYPRLQYRGPEGGPTPPPVDPPPPPPPPTSPPTI